MLKILITKGTITLDQRLEISFKRHLEGPKFSRLKFSRPDKNPRKFLAIRYKLWNTDIGECLKIYNCQSCPVKTVAVRL